MNRDPMNNTDPETGKELPPVGIFLGALEEYIVELRQRLIIAAAGFLAAVVLCFFFSGQINNRRLVFFSGQNYNR